MALSDKGYVCTLDEKSLKKAKEELNEDPKNRLGAVEAFRKWILEQPHISCPTDTAFLLCFLRVRYFSQLEARELLQRYLLRREKVAKWYIKLDPCDPKTLAAIESGSMLILPERDDEGRKVFIWKMDENTCVNGTVTLLDLSNLSLQIYAAIPVEDRKAFGETWQHLLEVIHTSVMISFLQNNFPARVKLLLIYNGGAIVDMFFVMLRHILSEKLQKRVKNAGHVLENVYKDIPMRCLPVEYLPDDYKGPNAGTEKQIIESTKRDLTKPEVRARLQYISSDKWKVDKGQKPSNEAPSASFRKLNID